VYGNEKDLTVTLIADNNNLNRQRKEMSMLDKLSQDIQRDIKIQMQIQSKLGKKTYKNIWVGSGWISLDKDNTLTFKMVKYV